MKEEKTIRLAANRKKLFFIQRRSEKLFSFIKKKFESLDASWVSGARNHRAVSSTLNKILKSRLRKISRKVKQKFWFVIKVIKDKKKFNWKILESITMTDVEHELSAIRFVVVRSPNYFLIRNFNKRMCSIKSLANLCEPATAEKRRRRQEFLDAKQHFWDKNKSKMLKMKYANGKLQASQDEIKSIKSSPKISA